MRLHMERWCSVYCGALPSINRIQPRGGLHRAPVELEEVGEAEGQACVGIHGEGDTAMAAWRWRRGEGGRTAWRSREGGVAMTGGRRGDGGVAMAAGGEGGWGARRWRCGEGGVAMAACRG